MITERPVTVNDVATLNEDADKVNEYYHVSSRGDVETHNPLSMWILSAGILLVLGLVLVVAAPQVRAQNQQLYAIGAPVTLVRQIGGYYGGLTAILGTWPAVIMGHLAALIFTHPSTYDVNGQLLHAGTFELFSVNWPSVLYLCLLVPAVSAAMGYFATRSNTMLEYRQD
ncbi:MAG: hypothetical protein Q4A82_05210 [Corynebacterium sp.]|nr:hypothetical protein [Corynebacterium sp.]